MPTPNKPTPDEPERVRGKTPLTDAMFAQFCPENPKPFYHETVKHARILESETTRLAEALKEAREALAETNTILMQVSSELVSAKDGPIGIFLSESFRIQEKNRFLLPGHAILTQPAPISGAKKE